MTTKDDRTKEINEELFLEVLAPPKEMYSYLRRKPSEEKARELVNHAALVWHCFTKKRAAFVKARKLLGGSY